MTEQITCALTNDQNEVQLEVYDVSSFKLPKRELEEQKLKCNVEEVGDIGESFKHTSL